jgi:ABC-type branched-subunit amino acid transport system ATPase component
VKRRLASGEIIFEGKPAQALEDENVMRALRG